MSNWVQRFSLRRVTRCLALTAEGICAFTLPFTVCTTAHSRFLPIGWKLTIVTGGLPVPQHAVSALVADVFTPDGRTHPGQAYVASGQLLAIPELPAISAGDVALAAVIQDDATSAWLGAALATTSVDVLAVLPDRAPASMDAGGTAAATQTGCYVVPGLHGWRLGCWRQRCT